jgi:glycosyltransferase involved in cell wall biosynthesis
MSRPAEAPRPVRLTLVTHYFPSHRGGVEAVAWEIASRLASSGTASVAWYSSATDAAPAELPGLRCVPVKACNSIERRLGIPFPLWSPAGLAALVRAVRESDAVHLHDFLYPPNLVAWAAARLSRRPVIVTQHVGMIPYRNPVLRALLAAANRVLGRLVLGSAAQALFVSDVVRQYFEDFVRFRRPPLRVPNGVDVTLFRPADDQRRAMLRKQLAGDAGTSLLLFAGRFVEKKGLALLHRLAHELPRVRWMFAGWGPLDPSQWGLANVSVHRDLAREDLVPLYQAADLLVLPSVGEGFPLVVQEAMACGTPAIVSEETGAGCPEAREVLLCETLTRDDAAARWRTRIAALLSGADTLGSLRPRVAEFARVNWSWDRTAERYSEIVRHAAGAR